MDLSGIIFVVLAVAWGVYLIPKALKHHDEIARTRSVDRFSTAMRVLARREPVNRRDTRLVVTPPRPGNQRMVLPTHSIEVQLPDPASATESMSVPDLAAPKADRAAARAAARRRRRILGFFVVVVAAMGGVAGFGYLPWWSLAVPGGVIVAYLVLCRVLVRRERRAVRSAPVAVETGYASPPRRAVRVEAPYGTAQAPSEVAPAEPIGPTEPAAHAVAGRGAETGSLWDPLPITLPTYVDQPRASRTVRTIDLSQPNTWSSGRSEADSRLVEETAAAREEAAKAAEQQRAVGS